MTQLTLLLFLLFMPIDIESQRGGQWVCRDVWATLHANFESVFSYFPERQCDHCDGYIATLDRTEMNSRAIITIDGVSSYVSVADTARLTDIPRLKAKYGDVVDVSINLWPQYQIENNTIRPIKIRMCTWD